MLTRPEESSAPDGVHAYFLVCQFEGGKGRRKEGVEVVRDPVLVTLILADVAQEGK